MDTSKTCEIAGQIRDSQLKGAIAGNLPKNIAIRLAVEAELRAIIFLEQKEGKNR